MVISRLFLFVLAAVLGSTLLIRHAEARPADYSPDSLSAMMLSTDDVNAVVGPDDSVVDTADASPASDSTVRVVHILKTNKGILIVSLFANADGSAPSSDALSQVMGDFYLNGLASTFFSSIGGLTDGGSIGLADSDRIVSFQAQLNGANWDSTAVLFNKGAVYGAVLWASPVNDPSTDGAITGSLYGVQIAKLQ